MVGLGGQFLFMSRFVVQWVASERARRSVVPVAFWWISIGGAAVLLSYAIWRADPVFILGQSLGFVVYARNLWLIYAEKKRTTQLGAAPDAEGGPR
ncbi:MAG: lipid-A-disaccharide synthase N-terminal domain-containing protein [Pseudomonadota bacterium]